MPAALAAALVAAGAAALVVARTAAGAAPTVTGPAALRVDAHADGARAAAGLAMTAPTTALSVALSVALSAPPAVAPGGSWRVAARVANPSRVAVASTALTLTWPATVTLVGASTPVSATPGRLRAVIGPIAGVTTATFTATLTLPPDAVPGGSVDAAVAVGAAGVAGVATATVTSRIRSADLRTEIATEALDARPGEYVTWTVLAANVAGVPAEDVALEIALGADLAFVTDTLRDEAARTLDGPTVRWRFPALSGPSARHVDLVTEVRPGAAAGAVLAPRASIRAATGVTRTFDDVAVARPLTVVVPDLWLSALGPLSAARGSALSWQLRWGNRAGARAKDIVVTATLPAGVVLVRTIPPATVADRSLRWERGAADPEGEAPIETLRVEAEVAPDAPAALHLDAAVRSLGREAAPADNVARASTRVLPGPPARIVLSAPPTLGVGAARSVEATVLDRAGEPVADGAVVRWATTFGVVTPEEGTTLGGRATALLRAGDAPGVAVLTARVDGLVATSSVAFVPAALRLSSTLAGAGDGTAQAQIHPGDGLSWVLGVHNGGDSTARDLRLVTELPDGLALEGASGSRPIAAVGEPRRSGGTTERVWRLDDLEPGGAMTVTLSPRVVADAPWTGSDLLFARAEITTTTAVALARDLVRIEQLRVFAADLRAHVRLDGAASSLRPGGWAVYDIGFSNGQPQTDVQDAVLTSSLPAGARYDHWQADVGTQVHEVTPFDPAARTLAWAIDQSLAAPGALRLWLRIDADAAPASALVHSVAIGSSVPDIDGGNDARFDSTFLSGIDLRTTISGPAEAEPGAFATYRIDVQNAAPNDAATLLTLTAILPPGTSVQRVDDPGQVTAPGRIRWDFERLPAGASRPVSLDVRLPADAPIGTALTLRADASASEPEGTPADNGGAWTTRLVPGPAATVTVRVAQSEIVACAADATTVTATVLDSAGRAVADGTAVEWRSTAGRLDRSAGVTTGGSVTATLAGGAPLGMAVVSARAGPATGQAVVQLVAGAPASLALSAVPDRAPVGGVIELVAAALDGCGNTVADGWPVTFSAERGTFDGGGRSAIVATIGGAARARLFVGPSPGRLGVAADHGAVRGEAVVDVVPPTAAPPPPRYALWLPFVIRPRAMARPSP